MVLTQRQLQLPHDYRAKAPLQASRPSIDAIDIQQGHYRIGAKQDPAARARRDRKRAERYAEAMDWWFGSLTDAIHLINYAEIPTISIGPRMQPAHMADEYIEIKELLDLTKIIALLILRWCGTS